MQYSTAFCIQPEAASDIIYGVFVRLAVPGNARKKMLRFSLNSSREIRPKAAGGGIFESIIAIRPEGASDFRPMFCLAIG